MQRGILKEYSNTISYMHRTVDCLIGTISALIAYVIYPGEFPASMLYQVAAVSSSLLIFIIFPRYSLYKVWRGMSLFEEIRFILTAWLTVFAFLVFLAVATKTSESFSRIWMGLWIIVGAFLFIISRIAIRNLLRRMRSHGMNSRNIVVVGSNELSFNLIQELNENKWAGFKIMGYITNSSVEKSANHLATKYLGGISDLSSIVMDNNVDQVWITLSLKEEDEVKSVLDNLKFSTVDIRYVLDIFGLSLFNHSLTEVAGYPVVNLSASPIEGLSKIIKTIEDYLLALIFLIIFSPIWLLILIILKITSKDPVLFKQVRHGWDGKRINVYKFRTMNSHEEDVGLVTQASKNDSRVTKFGRLLRRTSLDELPQLFNVLQGRMSLVGPRPHAVEHNEVYKKQIKQYMLRHKVKPGITGWAQVSGYRGEIDSLDKMKKRVEYDIYYIENWSLWFDIKILLLTIFKGFMHKNAY